jgi:hypothetical protein
LTKTTLSYFALKIIDIWESEKVANSSRANAYLWSPNKKVRIIAKVKEVCLKKALISFMLYNSNLK